MAEWLALRLREVQGSCLGSEKAITTEDLVVYSNLLQANAGIVPSITSRTTVFPIYYLLIILRFIVLEMENVK
jgi:hypothetical protein